MIDRRHAWRFVQVAFLVVVIWYAWRLLAAQWGAVRALRATVETDWSMVIASGLTVFASYFVLIQTWRGTVQAWGERLPYRAAVRIWFVSNLGKYIPGKVWQIGAMGVLAQRVGVSAVAAVGSAIVVSLIHVLVGFVVLAFTAREMLEGRVPPGSWLLVGAMALGVVAAPWLIAPVFRLASRVAGRDLATPALPPKAIWIAAVGCLIGWVLFGVAFELLAAGLLGDAAGATSAYVAVFTLSYLLGFLALFAPGGLGVRELSMATLLVSAGLATGPEAAWLTVGSRLWLTVLEILPGALLLLVPTTAVPPAATPSVPPPHQP